MIGEKKIRKRETENDNTIWALQLPHEIVFYEQNTAKNCFYHVSKDSMLNRLTTSNANKLPPTLIFPFPLENRTTTWYYFLQKKTPSTIASIMCSNIQHACNFFYKQNTAKDCFYHMFKDSIPNQLTTSNENKLPPPL